ncbi:hypothetical protein PL9214520209 [Planktothrix tepida PCC 9214]|uniref:Uncharacterized protein n=1 Tax=Planktothrix tepida PCC 9214 TaxID=671072 RepID=A0A1J1LN65_9CYAN|nr:hypothetical protein [Planktothrix tepida]CUR33670.1 hypothetical protein PL9214520209 [Planktothrix tepida PCC 9214]
MNTCPCCSESMLRHTRNHQVYWFCRHCWEEMPVFELKNPPLSILSRKETSLPSQPSLVLSLLH